MKREAAILAILLLPQVALADTEFWSANAFQHNLTEKVKFNINPELRFKNNGTEFYYLRTYIGPSVSLSNNIEVAAYYAPHFGKTNGNWLFSNYTYLDGILKLNFPWFVFSNRARFEYDITASAMVYRNLFLFKHGPWSAGDELFYSLNGGFFNEGRAFVAYSAKILEQLELSGGFLQRRQKSSAASDWTKTNVFTLGAKVNY